MAANSKIEWTHHTFNPWIGCTKVAAGCQHCYAERDMDKRLGKVQWGPSGTRVKTSEANWKKPLAWNRAAAKAGERHRVFCASLADVFEDWDGIMRGHQGGYLHHADKWYRSKGEKFIELDDIAIGKSRVTMNDLRRELFALIDATPHLDWLLLTKRPENIAKMWPDCAVEPNRQPHSDGRNNVWLGTSIANQADADRNIPELLKCRELAPVLFLSAEPLLGPVDLRRTHRLTERNESPLPRPINQLDLVICGGESGPHARPMHSNWARSLRAQCQVAGVPYFFKQWGEWAPWAIADNVPHRDRVPYGEFHDRSPESWVDDCLCEEGSEVMYRIGKKAAGRLLDGREWNELPDVVGGRR